MTGSATKRIFLHVGTPKTGTTYLQDLMWRNRDELDRRGVRYPGERRMSHFLAVMDLQGATVEEIGNPHLPFAWDRLVSEVRAASGTVVVSHELFAPMEPDRIERALEAFGGAELHVICTMRDLGRQLPDVWQEDLKNRHSLGFAEFLDAARDPADGHWLGGLFWRMQDVPDVLHRWAATLPPQRVHLVTVPRAGAAPELLWQRFSSVLGIEPDALAADPAEPNNPLSPAEAQLLRRINQALPPDLSWWAYERTIRRELIDVLARRPVAGPRITLPPDQLPWVSEQAKRMMTELADSGYDVVGDLDELLPAAVPAGPDPDAVSDSELLDVILQATRDIVVRHSGRVHATQQAQPPTLRQRVRRLGERNVAVGQALAAYRALRRSR